MAQNFNNIKLGPSKIRVNVGQPDEFLIETTIGGVVFNLKQTGFDVKTDQTGDSIVKKIKTAVDCSVDAPIGEYDLKMIAAMVPGSTLTGDGTGKTKVVVDANAGVDLLSYAKKIRIEPINAESDNDFITLYRAVAEPDFKFAYKVNGERVVNVKFVGYPDPDNNNQVACIGDETAVEVTA